MKKYLLKAAFVMMMAVCLTVSLAGCGGGSSDSGGGDAAGGSDSIKVIDSEWYGIDSYQIDSSSYLQATVGESLFEWDADNNEMVDGVCTDCQVSDDGKTMTFTVPEGMKYSTGEQVEPEDVVASIQHGLDVSPYGDAYENIESMETDGRQVIIHMSGFKSDMMYAFTGDFMTIIDKDELDSMSNDELMWGCHPYGMFYVDEYISGSEVKLKRNDGYWTSSPLVENKGPHALAEVDDVFNIEEYTAIEMLKNGEAQLVCSIDNDSKVALADSDTITLEDSTYPETNFIEVNTDNGSVFEDYKMRKALALLIDREKYCEKTNGQAVPVYSMISDRMQNFNADAKEYFMKNCANDPEEGVKLLEECGWTEINKDGFRTKDGKVLEIQYYGSNSDLAQLLGEAMQSDLAQYGIKVNAEFIDWNYVHDKTKNSDYDFAREGLAWAEPILILNCCYYDTTAPTATKEYYDMVKDIAATVDSDERTKKIGDIQMMMWENLDMLPFYAEETALAHSNDITGFNMKSDGTYDFNDIRYAG